MLGSSPGPAVATLYYKYKGHRTAQLLALNQQNMPPQKHNYTQMASTVRLVFQCSGGSGTLWSARSGSSSFRSGSQDANKK